MIVKRNPFAKFIRTSRHIMCMEENVPFCFKRDLRVTSTIKLILQLGSNYIVLKRVHYLQHISNTILMRAVHFVVKLVSYYSASNKASLKSVV